MASLWSLIKLSTFSILNHLISSTSKEHIFFQMTYKMEVLIKKMWIEQAERLLIRHKPYEGRNEIIALKIKDFRAIISFRNMK